MRDGAEAPTADRGTRDERRKTSARAYEYGYFSAQMHTRQVDDKECSAIFQ